VISHKTELLVEPADSKELASAIVTLLKDARLRKEYGEEMIKNFSNLGVTFGTVWHGN